MTRQTVPRDDKVGSPIGTPRRPWGSGSVFLHKGRWTASVALPPDEHGNRRRRWIRTASRADAEKLVAQMQDGSSPPRAARHRLEQRLAPVDAIHAVFARARQLGWDDDLTARVIVASLAVARLRFGVIGPCVYCGDELANTVDHIDPHGGNDPENVASACRRCNNAKGKRTPEQWLGWTSVLPGDTAPGGEG